MIVNDDFSNWIGLLFAWEQIIGSSGKFFLVNWFQTLLQKVDLWVMAITLSREALIKVKTIGIKSDSANQGYAAVMVLAYI